MAQTKASEVPEGLAPPTSPDAPVVLYTTPWCGFCRAALALLQRRQIEFVNVDVMGNLPARNWLMQVTGRGTVPQIFIHGESIGGFDELAQLDGDGSLHSMVTQS